ncbi:hypothetical protein SDC9_103286 [bioreactor metagenome]|uniref:Uncharacterized protein n=1 Tax=bioreactor metagenome TaxID=1076179 RepID=A0A645ATN5_9ZZZZ
MVEEVARLPLHNGLELLAGDLHAVKRVVILVNLHAVPIQEGALFQVGARVEQGRQGHVRLGVFHLHLVNEIHNRIVLQNRGGDAGKQLHGVQERLAHFAHCLGGQGLALVVKRLKPLQKRGVGRRGGAVEQVAVGLRHIPPAVLFCQGKGYLGDVLPVGAGLQHGNAVDCLVYHGVGMADKQRVDPVAVSLGNLPDALGAVFAVQPVVHGADDHIGLPLQLGENFARFLHGGGEGHVVIAGRVGFFPDGDVGRVDAEHRHLHAVHVKDVIGVQPAGAVLSVNVTCQSDALKVLNLLGQVFKLKVKFVIAQSPRVVIQIVQRVNHGVRRFSPELLNVVGLGGVAGVNEEQLGVGLSFRRDDGRRVGHAGFTLLIGRVVEGIDHAVQVAGLENGKGSGILRRQSGDRQTHRHHQSQKQRR